MKRVLLAVLVAVVGGAGTYAAVVFAQSSDSGAQQENMRLIANYDDGGTYRNGTDMAFWRDRLLLGNLDQSSNPIGGFRLMDISKPAEPRQIGRFTCPGDQSDVSIWRDVVVLSVDKPTESRCEASAPGNESNWEGVRIISIADPENPEILSTVRTDCGSHTNTIYPDPANDRLLVYVLSYPLAGRYNPAPAVPTCNAASHRKISVVEVPLSDPGAAEVIGMPSVETNIGCHDVTLFLERELAAAACLTESQVWDLSNPEHPEVVSTIRDPRINIHHSTVFSNDGRTLVVGDELGGAAASPGCLSDEDTYGGLFFYDVEDPAAPQLVGTHKLQQEVVSEFCTAHLFNVVPRRDEADVLVSSWYAGSTSVIDFTDPSNPRQIAFYIPPATVTPDEQTVEAAAWSSYWYNGYVYANNFDEDVNSLQPQSRGLDVFAVDHPLLKRGVLRLPHLNPQVQEPLPGKARGGQGGAGRGG